MHFAPRLRTTGPMTSAGTRQLTARRDPHSHSIVSEACKPLNTHMHLPLRFQIHRQIRRHEYLLEDNRCRQTAKVELVGQISFPSTSAFDPEPPLACVSLAPFEVRPGGQCGVQFRS